MLIATTIIAAALALPPALQPASRPVSPTNPNALRYFEVPLQGEVGKEITAPGVRDAIKAAASKQADVIVFVIDTPGGRVADADMIAKVMDRERAGLKYYAIVNRAISAAVWPLSRMDRVFFAPGATAGAAVAFSVSRQTGNAEVDAKMNAALTADVSAAAELRGQPGSVYRAMMLQSATLYRWKDGGGRFQLGETAPAGAKEVLELDGPGSVLAWTTDQAAESGFGTLLTSRDPATLGQHVGAEEWIKAGDGAVQMTRAFRDIERDAKKVEKAKEDITETREKIVSIAKSLAGRVISARNADPRATVQVAYRESGTLTSESQMKWKRQSDVAINAWSDVVSLAGDLQRAERKAAAAVTDFNKAAAEELSSRLYEEKHEPIKLDPVEHNLDLRAIEREASETLARVRRERVRSKL
jgi:hypothetical protein